MYPGSHTTGATNPPKPKLSRLFAGAATFLSSLIRRPAGAIRRLKSLTGGTAKGHKKAARKVQIIKQAGATVRRFNNHARCCQQAYEEKKRLVANGVGKNTLSGIPQEFQ